MNQGVASIVYSIIVLSLGVFLLGLKNFSNESLREPGFEVRFHSAM